MADLRWLARERARAPSAICSGIMASRPGRPLAEIQAVRAAAPREGSASHRAAKVAFAVACEAVKQINADPGDHMVAMAGMLTGSPIAILAADPEIDTAALVRLELLRRLENRAFRRLSERDWPEEDRQIIQSVAKKLGRRYSRHLAEK